MNFAVSENVRKYKFLIMFVLIALGELIHSILLCYDGNSKF